MNLLNSKTYYNKTINIGYPIPYNGNDRYALLGKMIWGFLEIAANWVNTVRKGIVIGNERLGINLILVEDYSSVTDCYAASKALLSPSYGVNFMLGPYSAGLNAPVFPLSTKQILL